MPKDVGSSHSVKIWIFSSLVVIPTDHPYTVRAPISLISPPIGWSRLLSRSKNVADKAEPVVVGLGTCSSQRSGWVLGTTGWSACPACVPYSLIVVDGFVDRGIGKRRPQTGSLVAE